jgi:hypothetical protein
LPGGSHKEATRSSGARLLLLCAVDRPVVIVTTEGTLPVAIVVVITVGVVCVVVVVIAIILVIVLVVVAFAMQRPAAVNCMVCFPTVIAALFVLLRRHRGCDLANTREMDNWW